MNGPVPECLRLVHGKELPVPKGWNSRLPTWEPQVTIARNCRFSQVRSHGFQPGNQRLPLSNCRLPEVGTHAFQPRNHRLPLQRTSRPLKVGTDGSHCGNQRLPWQGTAGSQTLKLTVPNLRLEVAIATNCRFPEVRTYVFEAKRLS